MVGSSSGDFELPFGAALRRVRLAAGLTQEQLGLESGVQRNFISLIETGQNQPTIGTIARHVAGLLGGKAKAMVVTGSRKEAVRWQIATRKYIADHGYKIQTLVAFSGEVIDVDSGPESFTEHSKELNPGWAGRTSARRS